MAQPSATRVPAALLTEKVLYNIGACQNVGTYTFISGWAFRPAPGWNPRDTLVTLLFRHGETAYMAPTHCVSRPDVAAHFATQPPEASNGLRGLENSGFACEVLNDSLPSGLELQITLRLECGGLACEQVTAQRLRF